MKRFAFPLVVLSVIWTASALAAGMPAGLSVEKPLLVDAQARTVTFLAVVNGKFFYTPTRHAAVFKGGKFGDMAVLQGLVSPKEFHDALVAVGARPGENMTPDNMTTTTVQGDALEVSVTFDGAAKDYPIGEVIKDSNAKPIDIHFGGNLPRSIERNTGCLICLDSCPVGIASNAAYTFGAVEKRDEVAFTGIKEHLPADGGLVAVTVTVK